MEKKRQDLQSIKKDVAKKFSIRIVNDSIKSISLIGTPEISKIKNENDSKIKDIQYIDNILKIIDKNKKAK